ncbi:RDD family protein [Marinicella sp. S1101]|uniref:RDD family protein n=1 Tax=Marinicella marina TaxID=2996016 RepID=UPI0022609EE2|nr:RDD family protein [Marinicella marina]MCX7552620.1 RDD family protein [Marinicella marina]MDJ1139496.1 RDD family protein [Marinicella marina]
MYKSQLWKHLAALVYDIFPILALFLTTSLILILFRQGQEVQPRTFWLQAILFLEVFLYFAYSWKLGGQTLGMRAWKIKIENHQQLTWPDVTWRFLVGIFSTALLGLGWWSRRFNLNNLTWMDMACKQRVIDVSEKSK